MIKIGMLIADRYEILEKIGTGGMSDVYKAKDHKLNRFVAVKVLKQEFSENANFVSKFRVEAQAAAGLMHPNIVNVYDVGEEKGMYYIVMELVEGITLKRYIEKKARLSVKEAVSIAIQVSMGLEAAHRNHVIHRDIKPQNIIISKEGKVKVTDFGIAKAATSNTITSNVMGSVHYTSPEQARGGYSDEKSDIYSLGITLFEMLTGRVPFNGDTTVMIAIKHIQEPMPSPCEFVPEIPYSVEQIVLKCCEKSPDRRYQNMGELMADLRKSLVEPDGDFVHIVNPDEESSTRMVTDNERRDIRDQYHRRSEYGTDAMPQVQEQMQEEAVPAGMDERARSYQELSYQDNAGSADTWEDPRSEHRDPYYTDYSRERRNTAARDRNYEQSQGESLRLRRDVDRQYEAEDPYADEYATDRDYNPRMERVTTILAVAAAIVVGIIVIFVAARKMGFFANNSNAASAQSGMVTLTDVVGQDEGTARSTLTAAGLEVQVNYETSSQASGTVLSMDPAAGQQVSAGSRVSLTISGGNTEGIQIPDVSGMLLAEAKATLEKKGFSVNSQEAADETVAKGSVISQNPAAGSTAPSGTTITIIISTGPDTEGKLQMPTVTGISEAEATALLVEAGFDAGKITTTTVQSNDPNLRGLVSAQSIEAGSYVDADTAVQLTVAEDANVTYSYTADIEAPTKAEDSNYVPGTSVYVVIIAADGQKLLDTTATSFPVRAAYTHITSATGTLQMTYTNTTQGSVTTDPETGETVTTQGTSEQKTVTRLLTFTPEK